MKKFILITLIFVIGALIATDIVLVMQLRSKNEELGQKDLYIKTSALFSKKEEYLETNLYASWKYAGYKIPTDLKSMDTLGNFFSIREISKKGEAKLILRYQERNCQDCIAFGLSRLNELSGISTMTWACYQEPHHFKAGRVTLGLTATGIYNVSRSILLDDLNIPYYFILHEDLSISHLFIPEKTYPDITRKYLDFVSQNFR